MTEEELNWEVIVVGGGPAGMTAAIYAARYGLKTLLLESAVLGGAQATSPAIENYPGFLFITGIELASKMKEQVKKTGAKIREITEVKKITNEDGCFILETRRGDYRSRALIFATGGGHRHLNVPGESEFTGRGVSFCATCDGPLFREKKVLVIGGGNTAAVEAVYLSELTDSTTLIHRRDELRAEKAMQDMVFSSEVDIKWSHTVKEFKGDDLLREVVVEDLKTGETETIVVDGAFVALGSSPNSKLAINLGIETNKNKEIIVQANQTTNIPGFFAAGDVVESMKQIAVAVGQGAIAADSAYIFVRELQRTDPRGYGG